MNMALHVESDERVIARVGACNTAVGICLVAGQCCRVQCRRRTFSNIAVLSGMLVGTCSPASQFRNARVCIAHASPRCSADYDTSMSCLKEEWDDDCGCVILIVCVFSLVGAEMKWK